MVESIVLSKPATLRGLNAIRFICALWVVLGHFGVPEIGGLVEKSTPVGFAIHGLYNNAFSGPAAVIVFFVLSGLVIHLPQRDTLVISKMSSFFVRRYLRILPPMLVAIFIAEYIFDYDLSLFEDSILWSLWAELIYYSAYPLLLWARRLCRGWIAIIIVAFLFSIIVAATNPSAGNYPSYGRSLNWVLGLPCWLVGCYLAERIYHKPFKVCSSYYLWSARFGIWFLSVLCSVMRFHTPVGYPWTLNIFAILVGCWLMLEVSYHKNKTPVKILEWAGGWSYSLYLVHTMVMALWVSGDLFPAGSFVAWAVGMTLILLFALVFSLLVEVPSHKAARYVSLRI